MRPGIAGRCGRHGRVLSQVQDEGWRPDRGGSQREREFRHGRFGRGGLSPRL
jgi:hypothetical protein